MDLFRKIPLRVNVSFWITSALIGFFNTQNFIEVVLWIVVIFVSVLIHEIGHALPAFAMGLCPRIELVAFGGITHYAKRDLSLGRQFIVTIGGPLFGVLLFLGAFCINRSQLITNPLLAHFFFLLQTVNLFWTIFNFIPVLPLDGGQVLRIGLDLFFHPKGRYYALIAGAALAALGALFFFFYDQILLGAFFFLFAYQNGADAKKEKVFLPSKGKLNVQKEFEEAEKLLRLGQKEEALEKFETILQKAPSKEITRLVFEFLALLEYDKGNKEKALEYLIPYSKTLSGEVLYLLHKLSFELKNYALTLELSGKCFQQFPFLDVAERAALASVHQKEAIACIGWLEASLDLGADPSLIQSSIFDEIREVPSFAKWVKSRPI